MAPVERLWVDGPLELEDLVARIADWNISALTLREIGPIATLEPLSRLTGLVELDLSGARFDHRELVHLAGLPLRQLLLSGASLIELGVVREVLEERCTEDMVARMVLGSAWTDRYEFAWEEGYGDFWVEDTGDPPSAEIIETIGVEDYVAQTLDDPDQWVRLREAALLYDLDLAEIHGPLTGIRELPTTLEVLDLSRTPFWSVEDLGRLWGLRLLNLADTGVRGVAGLAGLCDLRALDLSGLGLDELSALSELDLWGLRLGGGPVDASITQAVTHLSRLRSLAITEATITSLVGLEVLTDLRQLTLYRCVLEDAGIDSLAEGGLEDLDLTRCRISPEDKMGLSCLRGLKTLRLSKADIEDDDLPLLAELSQLETLALGFVPASREKLEALAERMADTSVELAFEE